MENFKCKIKEKSIEVGNKICLAKLNLVAGKKKRYCR